MTPQRRDPGPRTTWLAVLVGSSKNDVTSGRFAAWPRAWVTTLHEFSVSISARSTRFIADSFCSRARNLGRSRKSNKRVIFDELSGKIDLSTRTLLNELRQHVPQKLEFTLPPSTAAPDETDFPARLMPVSQ